MRRSRCADTCRACDAECQFVYCQRNMRLEDREHREKLASFCLKLVAHTPLSVYTLYLRRRYQVLKRATRGIAERYSGFHCTVGVVPAVTRFCSS